MFRQRFVGITGEREAAEAMERVIKELQAAGATVVDVAIPDYDERYRAAARQRARVAASAGWTAYLSRGAKPGERVLTIEELIASGKMAPGGQRRLEGALAPAPTGAELDDGTRAFYARRETFRQHFVDLMERERLDAMLYPANQARPHTHEGGARALRQRTGHVSGERGDRAAAGDRAGRVHGRTLSGGSLVAWADVGRSATARTCLRLRTGHEGPSSANHRAIAESHP